MGNYFGGSNNPIEETIKSNFHTLPLFFVMHSTPYFSYQLFVSDFSNSIIRKPIHFNHLKKYFNLFFVLCTPYLDIMNYSVKENQSVYIYLSYCLNNLRNQIKH